MRQTLKSSAPAGLFWVGLLKKRGADTTRMATESADPFPCRGLEGGGVKQMKPAGRPAAGFILVFCGRTGIRTLGSRKGTTVFETAPIDHSGILPVIVGLFCVPGPGIEPGWIAPPVFETGASTDSAIRANAFQLRLTEGFECGP